MHLEVCAGLVVQFTPAEAREFVPQLQALLRERLARAEQEAAHVHGLREQFEESLAKLGLAAEPLLSGL